MIKPDRRAKNTSIFNNNEIIFLPTKGLKSCEDPNNLTKEKGNTKLRKTPYELKLLNSPADLSQIKVYPENSLLYGLLVDHGIVISLNAANTAITANNNPNTDHIVRNLYSFP
jgi:hypothetical protein